MTRSASNFLNRYRRNDAIQCAQLSFIAARSIHPRCNRAATVQPYVTRDPQDFYAACQLIAPRACWWRQYDSMTHYSPCTRCRTHMIVHAHNSHCFHARVLTWTRDTLTFVSLPYWITLALTILFLPIWAIPSPIELVLAPDTECLVNDIIS